MASISLSNKPVINTNLPHGTHFIGCTAQTTLQICALYGLTIYKVAPHTHLRKLKGKFENHVIRLSNKQKRLSYTDAVKPFSNLCYAPICPLKFFSSQSNTGSEFLDQRCLGCGQFPQGQHTFLPSKESDILITLMKAFTNNPFHKKQKIKVVANTSLKQKPWLVI